jgi:4-hydroxybenzoate polyprenyltransferase
MIDISKIANRTWGIAKEAYRVTEANRARWEIHLGITLQAATLFYFGEKVAGGNPSWFDLLMFALLGLFACAPCGVFNDIYDIEADKINHPERPLAAGRITIEEAWMIVVTTGTLFILISLMYANNFCAYFMLITHCMVSFAYSYDKIDLKSHWLLGPL